MGHPRLRITEVIHFSRSHAPSMGTMQAEQLTAETRRRNKILFGMVRDTGTRVEHTCVWALPFPPKAETF
jgi:hypothetical protein